MTALIADPCQRRAEGCIEAEEKVRVYWEKDTKEDVVLKTASFFLRDKLAGGRVACIDKFSL